MSLQSHFMNVNFFDNPLEGPRAREDVRFNQLAVYVHPDGSRRIAVGFDITPFRERPCIEVRVVNDNDVHAGSINVMQTMNANFHLTVHLRDREPTDIYTVVAHLYYLNEEDGSRMNVDSKTAVIDMRTPGSEVRA